jgi:hypothetical protein
MGPSKKPAKLASDEKKKVELIGSVIRYIGYKSSHFTCKVCGRGIIRGFIFEAKGETACSRRCLTTIVND